MNKNEYTRVFCKWESSRIGQSIALIVGSHEKGLVPIHEFYFVKVERNFQNEYYLLSMFHNFCEYYLS